MGSWEGMAEQGSFLTHHHNTCLFGWQDSAVRCIGRAACVTLPLVLADGVGSVEGTHHEVQEPYAEQRGSPQ